MAEKATIARPYAKAAFESARAHRNFDSWSQTLALAASVVADERVSKLLTNPRVKSAELINLIAAAAGGAIDQHIRNFLVTLADNRRLGLLPEIAAMYEQLRADVENVADVQIVSAAPLTDAQRERLASAIRKRLRREVRLHCVVDASLLGGAVVRSGDFVIDGSLKARLERLAGAMVQ
jgi:F-type H+-transporting ATPase subunit delta